MEYIKDNHRALGIDDYDLYPVKVRTCSSDISSAGMNNDSCCGYCDDKLWIVSLI